MGECNYYLKARFANEEEARSAEPRLAELLAEGEKAYSYWQGSRSFFGPIDPNRAPMTADLFWQLFYERFPLTMRYLGDLAGIDDWNNGLAGYLSLVDPHLPRRFQPRALLRRQEDLLLLQLNNVWHFSDMTLLERYCLGELGAVAAESISEERLGPLYEGCDPFDAIRV